jgi:HKD family nuclease
VAIPNYVAFPDSSEGKPLVGWEALEHVNKHVKMRIYDSKYVSIPLPPEDD